VEPSEAIEDFMVDHFVIATWSRDVLINGDLEALREPLEALATYDYRSVAPGGWMSYVAKMQQAARVTSAAQTMEIAAVGVATMARTCAECHVATGRGPAFAGGDNEGDAQDADTLGERMRRHMWAADRLWEGLTGPADDSWTAGAAVLARAPLPPPSADPPLPADYVAAITEVRELGAEALDASMLEARADVYGRFLASCAGCHALQMQYQF
jgi:mono/diheme cytochrome c family protein